ncbi:hypothetical protein AGMMS49983_17170 [Clostridia bacterium]|nr:hypothetical protein AGMMS49983_17170 [Clostridia bacterium]
MDEMTTLERKRQKLLSNIAKIDSMRKGSLCEQYVNVKHKDGQTVKKGPYRILTLTGENGKTKTKSIPLEDIPFFEAEVSKHKEYRKLTEEYAQVCEQISAVRYSDGTCDPEERGKKN